MTRSWYQQVGDRSIKCFTWQVRLFDVIVYIKTGD